MQAFPIIKIYSIATTGSRKEPEFNVSAEERTKLRGQLTPDVVIDAMTKHRVYQRDVGKGPESFCRLCLRHFCEGDYVKRFLECRHKFHDICIDNWLKWVGPFCPEDKTKLIQDEYEDLTDEEEEEDIRSTEEYIQQCPEIMESPLECKALCKSKETESKQNIYSPCKSFNSKLKFGPQSESNSYVENTLRRIKAITNVNRNLDNAIQRVSEPKFPFNISNQNTGEFLNEENAKIRNAHDMADSKESAESKKMYSTTFSKIASPSNNVLWSTPSPFKDGYARNDLEMNKFRENKNTADINSNCGLMSKQSRQKFQKVFEERNSKTYNLLTTLSEVTENPVLMLRRQSMSNFPRNVQGPSLYTKPRKLEYD